MFLKRLLKNKIFLIGLLIFIIGSGPLLATLLAAQLGLISDPNPNPVYLGMLAYFTFWPGLIVMLIGFFQFKKAKSQEQ